MKQFSFACIPWKRRKYNDVVTKQFLCRVSCGDLMGNVWWGENRAAAGVQLCKVLIRKQKIINKEHRYSRYLQRCLGMKVQCKVNVWYLTMMKGSQFFSVWPVSHSWTNWVWSTCSVIDLRNQQDLFYYKTLTTSRGKSFLVNSHVGKCVMF